MIDLGVNIDHVATLRNARGTSYPDPIRAALLAEEAGADVITLHLREDRRHIVDADVRKLRPLLKTRMNLECAVTQEMLDIACEVQPHDVCLVPEKRQELTTEGGLDVAGQFEAVSAACQQLADAGSRVSLFIDAGRNADPRRARSGRAGHRAAHGPLCRSARSSRTAARIRTRGAGASISAATLGLKVNAGHGLHYTNVQPIAALEGIVELNIGHAIVAHAIFAGWDNAVREMKAIMVASRLAARALTAATHMAIYGIGTDIVQVSRVAAVMDAHERALRRKGARRRTNCASITRATRARQCAVSRSSRRVSPRKKPSRKRSASACAGR